MIICILPAPLMAWVASVKMTTVKQRAAAEFLQARGVALVSFESPTPGPISSFFRSFIDRDAFNRATYVNRHYRQFLPNEKDILTREDIDAILQLQELRDLDLIVRDPRTILNRPNPKSNLPASEIARLTHIPTLAHFTINAELDHESQLRLARLPEMQSLELPSTPISDEVLELLVRNKNIAFLECDVRKLSRNSMSKLKELPHLETLALHHLSQGPDWLNCLSTCEALRQLELSNSKIRRADAKVINVMRIKAIGLIDCDVEPGFFVDLTHSKTLDRVLAMNRLNSVVLHKRGYTSTIEADRLQELEDRFTNATVTSPQPGDKDTP